MSGFINSLVDNVAHKTFDLNSVQDFRLGLCWYIVSGKFTDSCIGM